MKIANAIVRRRPKLISAIAVSFACFTSTIQAASPDSIKDTEKKIEKLEKQQRQMLDQLKSRVFDLPASNRRTQLQALIAEIERRLAETDGTRTAYLTDHNMSSEMKVYSARAFRRIEDCGTRNFPIRNGKKLYGKGLVSFTLDSDGRLVGAEIKTGSGVPELDGHMKDMVAASAPFGHLPSVIRKDSKKIYQRVALFTRFNFIRDDKVLVELPANERCRWPAR